MISILSIPQIEKFAEEFYNFSSGMEKLAFVRKTDNGKWEVVSKKGKPLGTYDTKTQAVKRLRQIEFFKHKKASEKNPTLSYSAIIRLLNKECDEDTVKKFQTLFKKKFDELYLSGNEEPEDEAMEFAISSVEHFTKNANAIEMGNAEFAGKRLSDLVKFLLRRIPEVDGKRSKAIQSARKKLYMINEYDLAGKKTPPNSAIGQSIGICKTILLEHPPEYIRNVINALVRNL